MRYVPTVHSDIVVIVDEITVAQVKRLVFPESAVKKDGRVPARVRIASNYNIATPDHDGVVAEKTVALRDAAHALVKEKRAHPLEAVAADEAINAAIDLLQVTNRCGPANLLQSADKLLKDQKHPQSEYGSNPRTSSKS